MHPFHGKEWGISVELPSTGALKLVLSDQEQWARLTGTSLQRGNVFILLPSRSEALQQKQKNDNVEPRNLHEEIAALFHSKVLQKVAVSDTVFVMGEKELLDVVVDAVELHSKSNKRAELCIENNDESHRVGALPEEERPHREQYKGEVQHIDRTDGCQPHRQERDLEHV